MSRTKFRVSPLSRKNRRIEHDAKEFALWLRMISETCERACVDMKNWASDLLKKMESKP